ncbi:hypothetical protein D3C87_1597070 [compost metagenome]
MFDRFSMCKSGIRLTSGAKARGLFSIPSTFSRVRFLMLSMAGPVNMIWLLPKCSSSRCGMSLIAAGRRVSWLLERSRARSWRKCPSTPSTKLLNCERLNFSRVT